MTSIAHPAPRRLASFTLASVPGNERIALAQVARSVAGLGLSPARLDKLKTAVAEATMNAIEHGNDNRPELPVSVEVFQSGADVIVTITDRGGPHDADAPEDGAEVPDLDRKLDGTQDPGGWGLFLIRHMVDAMEVTSQGDRHTVRLMMRTRRRQGGVRMAEPTTTMRVRPAGGLAVVIDIKGDVTAASEAVLMSAYQEAGRQGARRLVLNFGGLEYMNSGGIGMLVTFLIRARRNNQELGAFGLSNHYREIFELTRLDEAITIYDDEHSALSDTAG